MNLAAFQNIPSQLRSKKVSLPAVADLRTIFILPTINGLLFMLIILAMLVASSNYNNNLGFIMTFLLASMAVTSLWHAYENLHGITVIACASDPVFAGEKICFHVHLHADNGGCWNLNLEMEGGQPVQGLIIHKNQKQSIVLQADVQKRGMAHLGPLRLTTCYPLGLFLAAVNFSIPDMRCLIYPAPIAGEKTSSSTQNVYGDDWFSALAIQDDFAGLATYTPGDELNKIYWKIYSRGQGLYVKIYDTKSGEALLLDWDSLEGETEWKLSRLCFMVVKADELDIEYALRIPGVSVGANKGATHLHNCLKSLALFNETV